MALKLGELVAVLKTDNRQLDDGLDKGRRKFQATGRAMQGDAATAAAGIAAEWSRGGRAAGDAFTRDANGRLRDGRGRFSASGSELGSAVADGVGGGMRRVIGVIGDVMSRAGQAAGPIGSVVMAVAAIGTAAAFAAPLVGVLGGALGSLPGLIGGLGVLTGTLGLGFMGLGDAFKKTAGGGAGGAMVDRAYQIAQAERRLRDANEEVLESQEALTRARERAKDTAEDLARAEQRAAENLEDLTRSLAGAKLDQEEAAIRVTEAQAAYNEAVAKGDPAAIRRADLALRQAKHAAEEAKDQVEDLGAEQAEAAKKGVKGSDEVKAAQERHRDALDQVTAARKRERAAVEAVEDAEHALQQARKPAGGGGGGGAAGEITRLAPSAAAAVRAIKSLKGEFDNLRLDVQERLFAGVGDRILQIADAWLPTLHRRLGSMASTLNGLFHRLGASVSKPQFIADMSAGMESVEGLIDRVGGALAGPFVDAWGRLSRAAAPFIDALGDNLGDLVEDFSAWIKSADESGKLESFFKTAAGYLNDIFDLGKDIGGVMAEFFSIWTDTDNADQADDLFDTIRDGMRDLRKWLQDPTNRENIRAFVDGFLALGSAAMNVLGWLVTTGIPAAWRAITWIDARLAALVGTARRVRNGVISHWNAMVGWIRGLPGRISGATRGMWDGIRNAFRSAINWVIARWNSLSFTLPSVDVPGLGRIGGATLSTPDIPYLAQGGIVPATPGGRLAVLGEGGQDEAVLPLSKLRDMFGRTVLELRSSGSRFDDLLIEILREAIHDRGGNPQVVLSRS